MTDLTSPRLIYLKGFLFLVIGVLASALLILEQPTIKVGFLLAVAIWAFARLYYFMFYVIEHYVDPTYKFAGIGSFARYLCRRRRQSGIGSQPSGDGSQETGPRNQESGNGRQPP
jgi:hypothetical protein